MPDGFRSTWNAGRTTVVEFRIMPLKDLGREDLRRITPGYVSTEKYAIEKSESRDTFAFRLRRVPLNVPYVKEFEFREEDLRQYAEIVRRGWSLGAYAADALIGLVLAEPWDWNRSVWVWEFGVAESYRRQGIGTRLMEDLSHTAREAGLRILICETQNTNVPAIDFYRSAGFVLDGVDLSYYPNEDVEHGEFALFMKKRLS